MWISSVGKSYPRSKMVNMSDLVCILSAVRLVLKRLRLAGVKCACGSCGFHWLEHRRMRQKSAASAASLSRCRSGSAAHEHRHERIPPRMLKAVCVTASPAQFRVPSSPPAASPQALTTSIRLRHVQGVAPQRLCEARAMPEDTKKDKEDQD